MCNCVNVYLKCKLTTIFVLILISIANGIADALERVSIRCIGCTKNLARLESSKFYCRQLLDKYGMSHLNPRWIVSECSDIPRVDDVTPDGSPRTPVAVESSYQSLKSRQFNAIEPVIRSFVGDLKGEFVVKSDGLKGGKGVFVSGDHFSTIDEGINVCRDMFNNKETFLIEEKLVGQEFSLFTLCDGGNHYTHCPVVRDYKRALVSDQGFNTGGMGTVTVKNGRMPFLTETDVETARNINEKVCERLMFDNGGEPYFGVLYGSFIKTNDGEIKVIEYNVRFGDPEAINILGNFVFVIVF